MTEEEKLVSDFGSDLVRVCNKYGFHLTFGKIDVRAGELEAQFMPLLPEEKVQEEITFMTEKDKI